jgi:hypothetical protein
MTTDRKALDRLADAMCEDIMAMTDEEILAEFAEDVGDPHEYAAKMRALFEDAIRKANEQQSATISKD